MMPKSTFQKIIFTVVAVFLMFYLMIIIINFAEIDVRISYVIFALGFLGISTIYNILNIKYATSSYKLVTVLNAWFVTSYFCAIIHSLLNPSSPTSLFLYFVLLLPLSMFWYFYLLSKKFNIDKYVNFIIIIVTIFLAITYYLVLDKKNFISTQLFSKFNSSYVVMLMLPFLLCNKNRVFRIICISLVSIVVFSSLKRGGTLAVILAVFAYYFVELIYIQKTRFKTWVLILSFLIMGAASFTFFVFQEQNMDTLILIDRFSSISEDSGSGRLDIYEKTYEMITKADMLPFVFGHGFNAVQQDSALEYAAHNDFLEILYDFGLIIFILYVILHVFLLKFTMLLIKQKSELAASFAASYLLFFVLSMVSSVVRMPYYLLFPMFWGMVLGATQRKKKSEECL